MRSRSKTHRWALDIMGAATAPWAPEIVPRCELRSRRGRATSHLSFTPSMCIMSSDRTPHPRTRPQTVRLYHNSAFTDGDFTLISTDNVEFKVPSYHLFATR